MSKPQMKEKLSDGGYRYISIKEERFYENINEVFIDEKRFYEDDNKILYNALRELMDYRELEEKRMLVKLPSDRAWKIANRGTKYAVVVSTPIRLLSVHEIEKIDVDGRYWSTKEKAEENMGI